MKDNTRIIIVVVIFIILIICIIGYHFYSEYRKGRIIDGGNMTKYSDDLLRLTGLPKTYDKLLKITYSCSGNSNGNIYRVILDVENKKITEEEKEMVSDPLKVTEYSVTDEEINYILKDIDEYNFPEWKNEERDLDMIALDAAEPHLSFEYDNSEINGHKREFYGVEFNLKLAKDCNDALDNFAYKIQNLVKERIKLNEYMKEEDE